MALAFSRPAVLVIKLVLLALLVVAGTAVALVRWRMQPAYMAREAVQQPIPFSHKHHVSDDGIDCRYCHTSVERSATAGMPSTAICLGCHAELYRHAPALQPLFDSAATGRPIHWVRVYDLPDFAYFEHDIHIHKGVACIECHGRVDQMPRIWRGQRLTMQWCLRCHRDAQQHVRPLTEVLSMAPLKPLSTAELRQLNQLYRLRGVRGLTNCSTCHR